MGCLIVANFQPSFFSWALHLGSALGQCAAGELLFCFMSLVKFLLTVLCMGSLHFVCVSCWSQYELARCTSASLLHSCLYGTSLWEGQTKVGTAGRHCNGTDVHLLYKVPDSIIRNRQSGLGKIKAGWVEHEHVIEKHRLVKNHIVLLVLFYHEPGHQDSTVTWKPPAPRHFWQPKGSPQWLVVGLICTSAFSLGTTDTLMFFFSPSLIHKIMQPTLKKWYWSIPRTLTKSQITVCPPRQGSSLNIYWCLPVGH